MMTSAFCAEENLTIISQCFSLVYMTNVKDFHHSLVLVISLVKSFLLRRLNTQKYVQLKVTFGQSVFLGYCPHLTIADIVINMILLNSVILLQMEKLIPKKENQKRVMSPLVIWSRPLDLM